MGMNMYSGKIRQTSLTISCAFYLPIILYMMSTYEIDMSYKIEVKTKKKRENFLPAHAAKKCPLNRLVRYSKCPLNRDNTVLCGTRVRVVSRRCLPCRRTGLSTVIGGSLTFDSRLRLYSLRKWQAWKRILVK